MRPPAARSPRSDRRSARAPSASAAGREPSSRPPSVAPRGAAAARSRPLADSRAVRQPEEQLVQAAPPVPMTATTTPASAPSRPQHTGRRAATAARRRCGTSNVWWPGPWNDLSVPRSTVFTPCRRFFARFCRCVLSLRFRRLSLSPPGPIFGTMGNPDSPGSRRSRRTGAADAPSGGPNQADRAGARRPAQSGINRASRRRLADRLRRRPTIAPTAATISPPPPPEIDRSGFGEVPHRPIATTRIARASRWPDTGIEGDEGLVFTLP